MGQSGPAGVSGARDDLLELTTSFRGALENALSLFTTTQQPRDVGAESSVALADEEEGSGGISVDEDDEASSAPSGDGLEDGVTEWNDDNERSSVKSDLLEFYGEISRFFSRSEIHESLIKAHLPAMDSRHKVIMWRMAVESGVKMQEWIDQIEINVKDMSSAACRTQDCFTDCATQCNSLYEQFSLVSGHSPSHSSSFVLLDNV